MFVGSVEDFKEEGEGSVDFKSREMGSESILNKGQS